MRRFVPLAVLALLGCSGPFVKLAPRPPAQITTGATGRGSGCGLLLFDLIPIGVNGRTQRAYDEAVRQAGATALTDTSVTTRWYYAVIGTVHCTDVEGAGVR